MDKTGKKLAVSLVTSNAEKYLLFCLKSVFEQTFADFSLLVIDNGSNDETVRFIKENYPQVSLVVHDKNLGFAKAHNQAIAWTDSDYIMLLNQDVILEPDYFAKSVEFLDSHCQVAAVSGKILQWNFSKNQKTKLVDSLGLKIFKNHRVVEIGQGQGDEGQFNEVQEVFGVSGAAPIYRRAALEQVKVTLDKGLKVSEYLDEDFFSYKEDVDLACRLRLNGWQAFYLPPAVAYHDRTAKGEADLSDKMSVKARKNKDRQVKLYSYKNHLLVLLKNEFLINRLKFFWPIGWYEFKKYLFLFLFERSTLAGLRMYRQQKARAKAKRKFIIKNIRKITAAELAKWYQ